MYFTMMEYFFTDYISAEFAATETRGNKKIKKHKKKLVMPRETIEPLFTKQFRKGSSSVLPNIIVLPRIGNEPTRAMEGSSFPSTPTIIDGKRATKAVFKSTMSPVVSLSEDMDQNEASETTGKENRQARRRVINGSKSRHFVIKSGMEKSIEKSSVLPQSTERQQSNGKPPLQDQPNRKLVRTKTDSEQSPITPSEDICTFEDVTRRDLWHYTRQPEAVLARRESVCSSCGGAMSFSNSVSTRRFSTVSIEVPNENLMKNRFLNELASTMNKGRSNSTDRPPPSMKTDEGAEKISGNKARAKQNFGPKEFRKIEKEKNLLYDLMSVLYRKNFIKEEIRPYVRHALDICSRDICKD